MIADGEINKSCSGWSDEVREEPWFRLSKLSAPTRSRLALDPSPGNAPENLPQSLAYSRKCALVLSRNFLNQAHSVPLPYHKLTRSQHVKIYLLSWPDCLQLPRLLLDLLIGFLHFWLNIPVYC